MSGPQIYYDADENPHLYRCHAIEPRASQFGFELSLLGFPPSEIPCPCCLLPLVETIGHVLCCQPCKVMVDPDKVPA